MLRIVPSFALATLTSLTLVPRSAAADRYTVTDLGTLGGNASEATAMNERGDVVGTSATADGHAHPFLYTDGHMIDLGTGLGPDSNGFATGINNGGQVVGYSLVPGSNVGTGWIYSAGRLQILDLPPDLAVDGIIPTGINDSGDICGGLQYDLLSDKSHEGFILSNGIYSSIPKLGADFGSYPYGINDSRQVAGSAYDASNQQRAFVYEAGSMFELGLLPGYTGATATALNYKAQVVGNINGGGLFGPEHGFFEREGAMTDLGTLNGGPYSTAEGMSSSGQVVGGSAVDDRGTEHGYVYEDGAMVDLNDLITRGDIVLKRGNAINAAGQIVASATTGNQLESVILLTPIQRNRFAYALANLPEELIYTPAIAYNASGGEISIIRDNDGRYQVWFDALPGDIAGLSSAVAVTAQGSSTASCSVAGTDRGANGTRVSVSCFDSLSRRNVDSSFSILVMGNQSLDQPSAFAVTGGAAPLSLPDPSTSWTSGRLAITATHAPAVGDYYVQTGNGNAYLSAKLVTSTGAIGGRCNYAQAVSGGLEVQCFDKSGQPSDSTFSVLQVAGGRTGRRFGFAFANQTSTPVYTPITTTSLNSAGGIIRATRTSTGRYSMLFGGLQRLPGHIENVQVTGMGKAPRTCNVVGWGNAVDGLVADVECRDAAGNLADARYEILVIE